MARVAGTTSPPKAGLLLAVGSHGWLRRGLQVVRLLPVARRPPLPAPATRTRSRPRRGRTAGAIGARARARRAPGAACPATRPRTRAARRAPTGRCLCMCGRRRKARAARSLRGRRRLSQLRRACVGARVQQEAEEGPDARADGDVADGHRLLCCGREHHHRHGHRRNQVPGGCAATRVRPLACAGARASAPLCSRTLWRPHAGGGGFAERVQTCVHVHLCMSMCACARMHACARTRMPACAHQHACTCAHAHGHACTWTRIQR